MTCTRVPVLPASNTTACSARAQTAPTNATTTALAAHRPPAIVSARHQLSFRQSVKFSKWNRGDSPPRGVLAQPHGAAAASWGAAPCKESRQARHQGPTGAAPTERPAAMRIAADARGGDGQLLSASARACARALHIGPASLPAHPPLAQHVSDATPKLRGWRMSDPSETGPRNECDAAQAPNRRGQSPCRPPPPPRVPPSSSRAPPRPQHRHRQPPPRPQPAQRPQQAQSRCWRSWLPGPCPGRALQRGLASTARPSRPQPRASPRSSRR
mmetsp:Transcript_17061/g.53028  ORF Transcript_17061/g.53028 Transcript_17061/m.53028 type:complete len:271 (-) Transcript_17061:116-928(-)